jgi:ubiquinone/menaquinone biosynthesis C-methylase UbiE
METKDFFSSHAKVYAAFRPVYPIELYDFILQHAAQRTLAWDCGTGNGQVARHLARHFEKVFATDISDQQLAEAFKAQNIFYSLSRAEKTDFGDAQFDLVTVGQALHWFNVESFYAEVKRTGKKDGLIAAWGYGLLEVSEDIDPLFLHFYHSVVGPYWDEARRLVENRYDTIPFPFQPIPSPEFTIVVQWTREQFAGYLTSWSATQKYMMYRHHDPVPEFIETVTTYWSGGEIKTVTFPLFLKFGKIHG